MNGTTARRELTSACNRHHLPPPSTSIAWRTAISIADADQLRQLLAQCSLGDRRAFETLYRSVGPRLHGVALRFMGRPDLAEEVLQESFVRIWNNASRYEAHLSAPLTWMINITRNQAIDQLRKHRDRPLSDLEEQALVDESPIRPRTAEQCPRGQRLEPLPGKPRRHAAPIDHHRLLSGIVRAPNWPNTWPRRWAR